MIDDILKYLKEKKIRDYEVYLSNHDSLKIILNKNNIDFMSGGVISGLGVRIFVDSKLGFSSTTDARNYKKCVDTAIKVARSSKIDEKFVSFLKKNSKSNVKAYDKKLLDFGIEDAKEVLKSYVSSVRDVNNKISISEGSYNKYVSNIKVVNSEGVNVEMMKVQNSAVAELLIGNTNTSAYYQEMKNLSLKPEDDAKRLLGLVNKEHLKTNDMEIILHPEALSEIMDNAFTFAIDGENVNLKKSILHDKKGKLIFDKNVNIVDDATVPGYFNTTPYDDEGKATKRNVIVNNGVLKEFLYDSYNAYYAKKESTGNCSRDFNTTPHISPNNIIMDKGNAKDLIGEVKEGVYVRNLIGTHTMDTTTGDFSLGIGEGHYIKNGEIKHAIKDTMVAGNFFKLMKNIKTIGNEVEHSGGYYLPQILFNKIK